MVLAIVHAQLVRLFIGFSMGLSMGLLAGMPMEPSHGSLSVQLQFLSS